MSYDRNMETEAKDNRKVESNVNYEFIAITTLKGIAIEASVIGTNITLSINPWRVMQTTQSSMRFCMQLNIRRTTVQNYFQN